MTSPCPGSIFTLFPSFFLSYITTTILVEVVKSIMNLSMIEIIFYNKTTTFGLNQVNKHLGWCGINKFAIIM
jgi:hypothetical protein